MWMVWLMACTGGKADCVDAIVTDIDETLTRSDSEFLAQLDDPSYDPRERPDASTLMQGYEELGFTVIYVSTRGQTQPMADGATATEATDAWLTDHGFPRSPNDVFLFPGSSFAGATRGITHKASVVAGLGDLGWRFAHGYGNSPSDMEAFVLGGLEEGALFHVGLFAGSLPGVMPVPNEDAYTAHLAHLEEVESACR